MRTAIARHFHAYVLAIVALSLCSILLLTATTTHTENANAASPKAALYIALHAPPSIAPHSPLTYDIQIDNAGPNTAHDLKFRDRLPAGVTFVAITSTLGSCTTPAVGAGGIVNCAAPRLDPSTGTANSPWLISLVVQVTAPGGTFLANTATVNAGNDNHTGDNSATVKTTVRGTSPLATATATIIPGADATSNVTSTVTATATTTKTPTVTRTKAPTQTATNTPTKTTVSRRAVSAGGPFTVTSTAGLSDTNPGDGVCETDGSGCTLRAAIEEANADNITTTVTTINFDIPTGPSGDPNCDAFGVCYITTTVGFPLEPIAVPVTINGATENCIVGDSRPCIVLSFARPSSPSRKPPAPKLPSSPGGCLTVSGGNSTIEGLVINNCPGDGIELNTLGNDTIRNNFIGTDATGTSAIPNNGNGIFVNDVPTNTIGGLVHTAGACDKDCNLISGNSDNGVVIDGSGAFNNIVEGNYIGTDVNGTAGLGNGTGLTMQNGAHDNTIGGNASNGARNVVSGNGGDGIHLNGVGTGNVIRGNYIGVDKTGANALGNGGDGVGLDASSAGTMIGGTTANQRNIISANSSQGVSIYCGSHDNAVQGNYIGTDSTGTTITDPNTNPLGNLFDGVRLDAASNNTIGGTATGAGNLISGNSEFGVGIGEKNCGGTSDGNVVQGNLIGTDAAGTGALPNSNAGVALLFSTTTNNTIGGTSPSARNLISGNAGYGVESLSGVTPVNVVEGNYIGTDVSGQVALPNDFDGIFVSSGSLTIGGTGGARNVISGNSGNGVRLRCSAGDILQGNYIGVAADGLAILPNSGDGVSISCFFEGGAPSRRQLKPNLAITYNNLIGGEGAGEGNTIANNLGNGVTVGINSSDIITGNAILANSIFSNTNLGIDLGNDGVTQNDASGHNGPNDFQNFPVINLAVTTGTQTTIKGTLDSTANSDFIVEFFSNDTCDPSGYGEGQTFLGSTTVTTDGSGHVSFNVTLNAATTPGQDITSTATNAFGDTSEFSQCFAISAATLTPTNTPTNTGTATNTPTNTATRTITPTRTQTRIRPPGPSDTPIPTATNTPHTGGGGHEAQSPTYTNTPVTPFTETPTPPFVVTATETESPVPTETETETLVPTATETTVPTQTATAVPTLTLLPGLTPTATFTPSSGGTGILINQFRTRGPQGATDEFIEIVNSTDQPIDISGWKIKISDAGGAMTTLLVIGPNTLLQPGQHYLVANTLVTSFRLPLAAAGSVGAPVLLGDRLEAAYSGTVKPDQTYTGDIADDGGIAITLGSGILVDQVGMSGGSAFKRGRVLTPLTGSSDQSYHRKAVDLSGACTNTGDNVSDYSLVAPSAPSNLLSPKNRCTYSVAPVPAPGGGAGVLNLPFGIGLFQSSFFVQSIRGPQSLLASSIATLVTNFLLAILLAILFGFFGLLLYDTFEAHEEDIRRWLGPLDRLSQRGAGWEATLGERLGARGLAWLGDIVKIIVALLVFGLMYALIDPNFSFDKPDVLALIIAVALAIGLVNLFDDIFKLVYVRRLGARAAVTVHSGNLVIAALMLIVSRVGSLSPGILSVGPGGLEGEEKGDPLVVSVIGAMGYALPAIVAWLLLLTLPTQGVTGPTLWIATVLALIFAIGLQSVFFEMIPIPGLYGKAILDRSRILWIVLFALFAFLFLQTQLNPEGSFVGAFNKPNMQAVLVFVLGFCAFSAAVWFFFWRRDIAREARTQRGP